MLCGAEDCIPITTGEGEKLTNLKGKKWGQPNKVRRYATFTIRFFFF